MWMAWYKSIDVGYVKLLQEQTCTLCCELVLHTSVLLEEASQVPGEGIQTELISFMLTETNLKDRNS
jgi:hypothetical protein